MKKIRNFSCYALFFWIFVSLIGIAMFISLFYLEIHLLSRICEIPILITIVGIVGLISSVSCGIFINNDTVILKYREHNNKVIINRYELKDFSSDYKYNKKPIETTIIFNLKDGSKFTYTIKKCRLSDYTKLSEELKF